MNTGLTLERICQAFVGAEVRVTGGSRGQLRVGKVKCVSGDQKGVVVGFYGSDHDLEGEDVSVVNLQVVEPVRAWLDPSTNSLIVERRCGGSRYTEISQELLEEARR